MAETTKPLTLTDPDPLWETAGTGLCEQLRAALEPSAVHVEHIGSTAVPGTAATAVLDTSR
ncbi:GrpB-like predicted nucleotidyltransferase (UPF0157 family) [Kitasatospora gansuensis]|uniref:GrpB-like predicted nucleotidyltransferase (UPF0157 family) n=1 Tax=Kitasatospora gansuensis TaxID=258050 RepID=A0A7W7S5X7_9ACTN|nr:GrpB family protein [Kitasatospora gansuensis]MBB4944485.1 GrpB-like predicted nucleotidyltransferase (UPF0157 family) [Kitasatospora gansuensis]MBB4951847.1 GrpB-like predicted nucleotidyltransferase (UPF0157 family) [Kitasatospora gansuensis]